MSDEIQKEIDAVEKLIEDSQEQIEFSVRLERLLTNPDFKEIILEKFIVQEAAALIHASGDPNLKAENRADAVQMAQACGHLKRWINVQLRMADQARANVAGAEEVLTELRADLLTNHED